MGEPPNWPALLDGLGKSWEVANNSIKPYPAGFVIHPLLDLGARLAQANPGAVVEKVLARGNPLLVHAPTVPRSPPAARARSACSMPWPPRWCWARPASSSSPACVNDPKVSAMRKRISVASDPNISTIAVEMEFTTADGKVHKMSTQAAKGSAANPLKDGEIERKLRDEAKSWNAETRHPAADRCRVVARQEPRRFGPGGARYSA